MTICSRRSRHAGLPVFVQIEPSGLVYAHPEYTRHDLTGGTLVYVPFAQVVAAVS
jgi:hypothetical protein